VSPSIAIVNQFPDGQKSLGGRAQLAGFDVVAARRHGFVVALLLFGQSVHLFW
jgi:hypothetical protein